MPKKGRFGYGLNLGRWAWFHPTLGNTLDPTGWLKPGNTKRQEVRAADPKVDWKCDFQPKTLVRFPGKR